MTNTIKFPGGTLTDTPAEDVLEPALDAGLDYVLLIATGDDGDYFASSSSDIGRALLMMEKCKQFLLRDKE